MSALEDFEDIRDKIEKERWTNKQVSGFLIEWCPGRRGFSVRSVERFCGNKGIHKTSRIDDQNLDLAVSKATATVRHSTCWTLAYSMLFHAAAIIPRSSTPFCMHAY